MSRAFTAADVVQAASAQLAATATPGVAFTNPAVEGHAGIIVMGAQSLINAPEQWHLAATAGTGGVTLAVICRPDLPDQDQSWTFTPTGGSPRWTWLAEEWTNVSFAAIAADPASTSGQLAPASISTGTSGTTDAPYVACVAAVQLLSTGGSAWPGSVTWSNSFTETDVLSVGDGTVNGDIMLRVARYYGALNETGGFETTATLGTITSKTAHACIAVFRAEELNVQDPGGIMTSG